MNFKYKEVVIDEHKFIFKFLISIEDYELEKCKGKISIGAIYYPNFAMYENDAEKIVHHYLRDLQKEVNIIISEYEDFYKNFRKTKTNFGSDQGTIYCIDYYVNFIFEKI